MDTKRLPSELLAPLNRPQPSATLPADAQRTLLALLDGLQHAVDRTERALVRGRSHVRKRFHQLDGWIIRRLWSHRTKRWRNAAWREYPTKRLRTEFKLVSLVSLIPSLQTAKALS